MIVIAIIATLATLGFVKYRNVIDAAEGTVVEQELKDILVAIEEYELLHGALPATLDDLGLGPLLDPWGNPYQYLNFALDDQGNGNGNGGGNDNGNSNGNGGNDNGNGGGGGNGGKRKDHFLVPINTSFDLYSMGPDGKSVAPLTAAASQDDIIVANDGAYVGPASQY